MGDGGGKGISRRREEKSTLLLLCKLVIGDAPREPFDFEFLTGNGFLRQSLACDVLRLLFHLIANEAILAGGLDHHDST